MARWNKKNETDDYRFRGRLSSWVPAGSCGKPLSLTASEKNGEKSKTGFLWSGFWRDGFFSLLVCWAVLLACGLVNRRERVEG